MYIYVRKFGKTLTNFLANPCMCVCVCVCVCVCCHAQLFATPWTVRGLPGLSVHGISQARIFMSMYGNNHYNIAT